MVVSLVFFRIGNPLKVLNLKCIIFLTFRTDLLLWLDLHRRRRISRDPLSAPGGDLPGSMTWPRKGQSRNYEGALLKIEHLLVSIILFWMSILGAKYQNPPFLDHFLDDLEGKSLDVIHRYKAFDVIHRYKALECCRNVIGSIMHLLSILSYHGANPRKTAVRPNSNSKC